ncbi:MAG: sensor histidine kinase KdpD [Planctomycetes bacterium]|nr:sensor histidine kinase KdpD [Planctomycetota bacterium]
MIADPGRPDPDALLARVKREEASVRRGRLKVWLGAAPGVGKTFAMLTSARRRHAQGLETVVGCVETHGRADTASLLRGLEVLPRRAVEYRGTTLQEFDLDAALLRRPALLLVDELAHTNAPGSRFGKRWEDVEALLEAGIDVETTLNVQHVESLVDVVAQITGVQVRETVPDRVLDRAAEIVLVDLPPDALLERLRAGKVYLPDVVRSAEDRFFKKGNLSALRELALRRTAQWVDGQLQTLRREQSIVRTWGTSERILVAVGPSPLSARLVRAAHRTAKGLHAELLAVYVETPASASMSRQQRDRVTENLRLAESLGARTATLQGDDAAAAIIAYSREHDVARIVVGKSGRSRLHELLFGSFPMDVIRNSGDIDVHVVRSAEEPAPGPVAEPVEGDGPPRAIPWAAFGWSAVVVAVASGLAWLSYAPGDLSTEAMVLMLGVVVVSLRFGRWPSFAAAVASAIGFNFLFTEPRFTFEIADPAYVFAFLGMLVVGLTVSTLVGAVREHAEAARQREHENAALSSLVRELVDAPSEEAVASIAVAHLRDLVNGEFAVLLARDGGFPDAGCVVASHGVPDWIGPDELGVARWCVDQGRPAGAGTAHLPGSNALFLPMHARRGRVGVVSFRAALAPRVLSPALRFLVTTFVEQTAAAIERLRLREEQLRDQRIAEAERLRSTLLASVSHDLRTPLTSITGAASTLLDAQVALGPDAERELLEGILQESRRLNELVANLVFATRFEAGEVTLRREWTSVEEVVGAALRRVAPQTSGREVRVDVAADLPLVEADPVLLEQAVYLLLDNAARHTPAATPIVVRSYATDALVAVEVADRGPGVPAPERRRIFERFVRGPKSSGAGLGLAICAAIAKAHGGSIVLAPDTAEGATFRLLLPRPSRGPDAPAESQEPEARP